MKYGRCFFIFSILLLAGCFGTITRNDHDENTKSMAMDNVLPGESQLEKETYRLAVLDVDDRQLALAKNAGVGTSIRGELLKHVSKSNVVIVNNKVLPGLKTAIRNKSARFSSKVDYAITGQVSLVNLDKQYTELTQIKDKDGTIKVTEPYCTYTAIVQGNVIIHDAANNLDAVQTLAISGSANKSIPVRHPNRICQNLSQTEVYSLIRSAGTRAASQEDKLLKSFFRPKG